MDEQQQMDGGGATVEVDEGKLAALMEAMKAEQSVPKALLFGIGAGLVAAFVWGLIAKMTGYEVGYLAIGVGFLVGFAIRAGGKGMDVRFQVMGAVIALLSVMLGRVIGSCMLAAKQATDAGISLGWFELFKELSVGDMVEIVKESFTGVDVLFYGLAVWAGWQYSLRQISEEELHSVLKPKS